MAGVAGVGREHVQRRTETQRKWIERGEDRVRREGVTRESVRSEVVRGRGVERIQGKAWRRGGRVWSVGVGERGRGKGWWRGQCECVGR